LAIHLDRAVNDGLVLDKHVHLRPVWSTHAEPTFEDWPAARIGAVPAFWELGLFDVQPATRLGADRSLIASGRLDNQLSCWAALQALVDTTDGFELAERDLELRGEGALLGTRQSGLSDLRFTRLRQDRDLLEQARGLARDLVGEPGPWHDEADALLVDADPSKLA
jgi:hypothetical protein